MSARAGPFSVTGCFFQIEEQKVFKTQIYQPRKKLVACGYEKMRPQNTALGGVGESSGFALASALVSRSDAPLDAPLMMQDLRPTLTHGRLPSASKPALLARIVLASS